MLLFATNRCEKWCEMNKAVIENALLQFTQFSFTLSPSHVCVRLQLHLMFKCLLWYTEEWLLYSALAGLIQTGHLAINVRCVLKRADESLVSFHSSVKNCHSSSGNQLESFRTDELLPREGAMRVERGSQVANFCRFEIIPKEDNLDFWYPALPLAIVTTFFCQPSVDLKKK